MINWSVTIPNSLNTSLIPEQIYQDYENVTQDEVNTGVYEGILEQMQIAYSSTSKQLDKLELKKKFFFVFCGIYFILLIVFINLPNLKINFSI